MFLPEFDLKNARYERKYVLPTLESYEIKQIIRNHPASFRRIYHPRYINNIYLDTHDMDFFFDNVSGKGSRTKVRIRWYGDLNGYIAAPVLEFKVREGMLGNKHSFKLSPFTFDAGFDQDTLAQVFRDSALPPWATGMLAMLKPAMVNRYQREYLLSFDQHFRLTLDDQLEYYGLDNPGNMTLQRYRSDDHIVEVKYFAHMAQRAPEVTTILPFRLSKSSKYVNGMELLHPQVM